MKNTTTTSKFPLPKDKGWVRLPERVEKLESSLSDSIRPYKVYTALLTQSGTNPPVATVLENTIGNIWWSYNGVNQFEVKSNDLFTEDKTILFIQGSNDGDTSSSSILNNLYHIDSDTINCVVSSGGNLNRTSIEIRVYN